MQLREYFREAWDERRNSAKSARKEQRGAETPVSSFELRVSSCKAQDRKQKVVRKNQQGDGGLQSGSRQTAGDRRQEEDGRKQEPGGAGSVFSSESSVYCPGEKTGYQENDHEHEVDAFNLLFVDCSQYIMPSLLMTKDPRDVPCFENQDEHKPKNGEDQRKSRYPLLSGVIH